MSAPDPISEATKAQGEALSLLGKAVADYRRHLIDGGMPEPLADTLAVDLNTRLMDQAFATPAKTMTPEEAAQMQEPITSLFRGEAKDGRGKP